ncbi:MAG: DUF4340 domain-containing protein [Alphaproteobacteria bacterium]
MNTRAFVLLAGVTAIAVIGAIVTLARDSVPVTVVGDREPAFPKLVERINDVGAIEIVTADHRFTITGAGDGWGIEEKNQYTVKRETVRNFLLEMASLRLVEGKTSLPDRYKHLQVEDPEGDESEARGVRFLARDGEQLGAGIIGRRKFFLYVDGRGGTYLRREGEARSWLAEGEVNFGRSPADWLDRNVFELDPKQVKRYTIRHPDGEVVTGRRVTPGEKVEIDGVPDNRTYKTDNEADRLALVVERFEFADVEPAPHQDFAGSENIRHLAEYELFNGLVLKFEVITLPKPEGASRFDEPPRWGRVSAEVATDAPEDGRAEATQKALEINQKVKGWEYRLEELDGLRTTKRLEDMLAPEKS